MNNKLNKVIEFAKKMGDDGDLKIYKEMPKGYKYIIGALTAPKGCEWIFNGKTISSRQRVKALLLDKDLHKAYDDINK